MADGRGRQALLWQGTSVLLVTNIGYRLIDFIYKAYLFHWQLINDETIGLLQVVLPVYLALLLIAGSGVPPAVGKLVAERLSVGDAGGADRIVRLALTVTAIGGCVAVIVLVGGARLIADRILGDTRTYLTLLALAPALLLVTVCGVFRGYFQGVQRMAPVAASRLIELLASVPVTVILLRHVLRGSVEQRLFAMATGITVGELFGLVTIVLAWYHYRPRRKQSAAPAVQTADPPSTRPGQALFRLATPITLSRLVATLSLAAAAILVPDRLMASGYSRSEAVALYGQLTGMAFYLVSLPSVLTSALAENLVPAVSAALSRRDHRALAATLEDSLGLTLALAFPIAACLVLLPGEISFLVFRTAAPIPALVLLAAASPLLYVEQIMTGVLQGLGKPHVNLRNFMLAESIALVLIVVLVPVWGLTGAALATAVGFSLEATLDYYAATARMQRRPALGARLGRPLAATAVMAIVLRMLQPSIVGLFGPGWAATVGLLALAAAVYSVTYRLLGQPATAYA